MTDLLFQGVRDPRRGERNSASRSKSLSNASRHCAHADPDGPAAALHSEGELVQLRFCYQCYHRDLCRKFRAGAMWAVCWLQQALLTEGGILEG